MFICRFCAIGLNTGGGHLTPAKRITAVRGRTTCGIGFREPRPFIINFDGPESCWKASKSNTQLFKVRVTVFHVTVFHGINFYDLVL